jgi:TolB-like protein
VLPFQNLGTDPGIDFLRFALPDEIATTLSYAPSLAIRPLAATRKYARPDADPQTAGRELQVEEVLAGHFLRDGDRLQVTLEVIDTESNRVLWRSTSTAAAADLIGLREQISSRLRGGLFPILGATSGSAEPVSRPRNPEAYDLFLKTAAISVDPLPNKQALAMLERAVALDPSYAPAWGQLGRRLYFDGGDSDGGARAFERARAAYERALAIDPGLSDATANFIIFQVEGGDLGGALEKASDLLGREPDSGRAHFTLGYVLRYAGLLEDSAGECKAARAIDPRNPAFRSCSFTFLLLGQYDRAIEYASLDAGSQYFLENKMVMLLRQDKRDDVLKESRKVDRPYFHRLIEAFLRHRPEEEMEALSRQAEAFFLPQRDSEFKYEAAAILAFCGRREAALRLLRRSAEENYLACATMDRDPMLAGVRDTPEFGRIRALALARQKQIVAPWKAKRLLSTRSGQ